MKYTVHDLEVMSSNPGRFELGVHTPFVRYIAHDLEVMASNPGRVELGVHSPSVKVELEQKKQGLKTNNSVDTIYHFRLWFLCNKIV